ncbi:putative short-chain dehydrogenases/reductase [Talaromyces proteolyticus]|uniref:Short-chain dehydrogenases/reductase n=1 Tax=Talaromyces proteolyticus TaxID=1131652 RepID=A0AAD4PXN2_9EURO|nr:putative short-chain dehydrogenases/reductase [Talaromyces proteolyticus]KAH8700250.1 putative short-chain dehydrogenases/reductase [Talaromyces proteolyticus]
MPTLLIIGAGSRVGQATAEAFANVGYKVAVASRTARLDPKFKHFVFDATKPETVPGLFKEVRKIVGIPSVVIYNAYAAHITKPEDPFETPIDQFHSSMNVNTTSPWVAAGESVKGFEDLGTEGLGAEGGTFIYTGNILNITVSPGFSTFGMGKIATSHLIQHLALVSYLDKPYKFYWGDQRLSDGQPLATGLSGPAHAELYLELAKDPKQRAWMQTFVKGQGYVVFPRQESWYPSS